MSVLLPLCAEPIKLAVTDKVGFVPKKPNLHLMEDDSKETAVYNFHFPGDAEGSESFDRMLHVLQCVVSGAAHTLVPLAQMVHTRITCNMDIPAILLTSDAS